VRLRSPRLDLRDVERAIPSARALARVQADGPADLALRLRGTPEDLRITGRIQAPPLRVADTRVLGGRADLDVRVRPHRGVEGLTGTAQVRDFGLRLPDRDAPVRQVAGRLRVTGQRLTLDHVSGVLGETPVRLEGSIENFRQDPRFDLYLLSSELYLDDLQAFLPGVEPLQQLRAWGSGAVSVRMRGTRQDLRITGGVRVPHLRLPPIELLGGQADLSLRLQPAQGWEGVEASVRARGLGLVVPHYDAPVRDLFGLAKLAGGTLTLHRITGRLGDSPVRIEGTVAHLPETPEWDLRMVSSRLAGEDLKPFTRRVETLRAMTVDGSVGVDLTVEGTPDDLRFAGSLDLPVVTLPQGTLRGAQAQLQARVQPGEGWEGVEVVADLAQVGFERPDLPLTVTQARGQATLAAGDLRLSGWTGLVGENPVQVEGTIENLKDPRLDLHAVTPAFRVADLKPFAEGSEFVQQIDSDGALRADLKLRGSLTDLALAGDVTLPPLSLPDRCLFGAEANVDLRYAPETGLGGLSGVIHVADAALATPEIGAPIRRVSGTVRLAADRVDFDEVAAQVQDSLIRLAGSLENLEEPQFEAQVEAPRVALGQLKELLPDVTALQDLQTQETATAQLHVRGNRRGVKVQGEVGLPPAQYREVDLLGGRAQVDLQVAPPAEERGQTQVEGTFQVVDAGLRVPALGVPLTGVSGELRYGPDGLSFHRFTALLRDSQVQWTGAVRDFASFRWEAEIDPLRLMLGQLQEVFPQVASFRELTSDEALTGRVRVWGKQDDIQITGAVDLAKLTFRTMDLLEGEAEFTLRLAPPTQEGERPLWATFRPRGVAVRLPMFKRPLTHLAGEIEWGQNLLGLRDVSATLGSSSLRVNGSLLDFDDPKVFLTGETDQLDVGEVLANLDLKAELPTVRTPQPVTAKVQLAGPLAEPGLELTAQAPEVTVQRGDLGPWTFTEVEVNGAVWGLDPPQLALTVSAPQVDLNQFKSAILAHLDRRGSPVPAAAADREGSRPGQSAERRAQSVQTPDAMRHAPRAMPPQRGSVGRPSPNPGAGLVPAPSQGEETVRALLDQVQARQPAAVSMTVSGPADRVCLQGQMEAGHIAVGEGQVETLTAEFKFFDQTLTVPSLRAAIGEATLRAELGVNLEGEEPWFYTLGEVEGLDLALLNGLDLKALRGKPVGGILDGAFQFKKRGEEREGVADLQLTGAEYDDVPLRQVEGTVRLRNRHLTLERFQVEDSKGRLRAAGEMDLGEAWDVEAEAREVDVRRVGYPLGLEDFAGQLFLAGRLTGDWERPEVTGTLNVFYGSAYGFPFNRLRLTSRRTERHQTEDGETYSLELTAAVDDETYRATLAGHIGHLDLAARDAELDLQGRLERIDLQRLLELAGRQTGPEVSSWVGRFVGGTGLGPAPTAGQPPRTAGTLGGEFRVAGRLQEPRGEGVLTWKRGRLMDIPVDTAQAEWRLADDTVYLDRLQLDLGASKLRALGQLSDYRRTRELAVSFSAEGVPLADWTHLVDLPLTGEGTLNVAGEVEGPIQDPVITAQVSSSGLVVNRAAIKNLAGGLKYQRRKISFAPLSFTGLGAHCALRGSYAPEDQTLELEAEADGLELAQALTLAQATATQSVSAQGWPQQQKWRSMLQALPRPLTGSLDVKIRAAGPLLDPDGRVEFSLGGATVQNKPLPGLAGNVALGTTDQAPWPEGQGAQGRLLLTGGIDGWGPDGELHLRLVGEGLPLAPYTAWFPARNGLKGQVHLAAEATGSTRSPMVVLTAADATVYEPHVGEFRLTAEGLTWPGPYLDLGRVRLTDAAQALTLTVAGTVPLPESTGGRAAEPPLQVRAELEGADLKRVVGTLPHVERLEGSLKAVLKISGERRFPLLDGEIQAKIPEIKHTGLPEPLRNVCCEMRVEGYGNGGDRRNEVHIDRLQAEWEEGRFAVEEGGWIRVTHPSLADFWRNQFNLRLRAQNLRGSLGKDLNFSGGQVDVSLSPGPGEVLNRLLVHEARAQVGPGSLRVQGGVDLTTADVRHFTGNGVDLKVQADRVPVKYGKALALDLSGALHLGSAPGQPWHLAGRVEVANARLDSSIGMLFWKKDPAAPPVAWPPFPELDVEVRMAENNRLRSLLPEIDVPFQATLRAQRTPQNLRLTGRANVERGALRLSSLSEQFLVQPSSAEIDLRRNPQTQLWEPFGEVQARVRTKIRHEGRTHQVTLEIRDSLRPGLAQPIDHHWAVEVVEADPPLARAEVLAALARREEFAQALEQGQLETFLRSELTGVAVKTAFDWAFQDLQEQIAAAFGLEEFRLHYQLEQPLEVQVGRHMVDRVYLTYRAQVGGQGEYQFKIDYEIDENLRVGASTNERSEVQGNVEYLQRFDGR